MPAINPLPTPPSRNDPANFSDRADAFLAALPAYTSEANALLDDVHTSRDTVQGLRNEVIAAGLENAAANAATATTKAAEAASSASEAFGYLQAYRATSYGALAADPVVDPNGNPPTVGDEYFNTSMNLLKRFNGVTWQASDIATANLAATGGSAMVGFQQAGVGAVATTVQDKLRETVSVKDFGAVGDGTTDDTAAIQAAIDYAKANGVGKVNGVSNANYKITSTLYIQGNYGLKGIEFCGNTSTITATHNGPALIIDAGLPTPAPEFKIRALVHGWYFNGPGVASTSSVGVQVQNGAAMIVRDCTIRNFYRGLYGVGCLISRFSNITLNKNYFGMEFIGNASFKPNDNHFTDMFIYDNTKAVRYVDFTNGAVNFSNCEIEGNNLAGAYNDGIKVLEFSTVGKLTMSSCHFEDNPGQYNIFYSGTASSHLTINGCEVIPGDACGNAFYVSNAQGAPNFTVIESRITNNDTGLGQKQIFVQPGCKGLIVGTFNGNLSGDVALVTLMRDGKISMGGAAPDAGGIRSKSAEGIAYDCEGQFRFVDSSNVRAGYLSAGVLVIDTNTSYQIGINGGTRLQVNRIASAYALEPGVDNTQTLGTAGIRWSTVYAGTGTINTSDARTKQQIRPLSDAERAVAIRLKSLVRAFKFNDAVNEKGEAARIHFGLIAQDVKSAFESEGLVAEDYAILCHDVWDDIVEDVVDEHGKPTGETAVTTPAGDRYGVRYEELLAFIVYAL